MALIDGLKGGQGYYPAAPILQYEAMQRPQPVALPAGGGRQSAKAPAKREYMTGLPGDVLAFEQMQLDAESIRLKLENGEDVSDEEVARLQRFYMTESANRSQIQMNYDYYKNRTENDSFSEYSNEIFLNEENQPVLGEDGKYLRVGSRMEHFARSGGGISQNGLIQPINLSQEKTSSKDYYSLMDKIFEEARSQSQDRYEAQLYVASDVGFTDKDKEVLVNATNVISENDIALSHAEGVILSRVMSGERQAYRGAKQAFIQNLENGGSLIPIGFFSKEKQEARKDDIVTMNGKDYIKVTEDDFGEFLVYDVKRNSAMHYKMQLDPSLFTSVVSGTGDGNKNTVGDPTLHLKFTNHESVVGAGNRGIVDFDGILEGQKFNTKQQLFRQNPSLLPVAQAAHQEATSSVDSNLDAVYRAWAEDNQVDPSKMDDAQREIARNTAIAKITMQKFLQTGKVQEHIKKVSVDRSAPKMMSGFERYAKGSLMMTLMFSASRLPINPGKYVGGRKDVGYIDTMPDALSDMTFNDYYNSAGEVTIYDVSPNDFKGTKLENGIMSLNSTDRLQIYGAAVHPSALNTGGREIIFMNPTVAISNFRIEGDVVGALKGVAVIPKEKSILEQIVLPFTDENGETLTLNDFKLSNLGIREAVVTEEMLKELNLYASGYSINDKILLVPSTLDGTNIHSQALGHAPKDLSPDRVNNMKQNAQSYSERLSEIISVGQ